MNIEKRISLLKYLLQRPPSIEDKAELNQWVHELEKRKEELFARVMELAEEETPKRPVGRPPKVANAV